MPSRSQRSPSRYSTTHRRARPEHPVAARRLGLQPGGPRPLDDVARCSRPALLHPPGEHQRGARPRWRRCARSRRHRRPRRARAPRSRSGSRRPGGGPASSRRPGPRAAAPGSARRLVVVRSRVHDRQRRVEPGRPGLEAVAQQVADRDVLRGQRRGLARGARGLERRLGLARTSDPRPRLASVAARLAGEPDDQPRPVDGGQRRPARCGRPAPAGRAPRGARRSAAARSAPAIACGERLRAGGPPPRGGCATNAGENPPDGARRVRDPAVEAPLGRRRDAPRPARRGSARGGSRGGPARRPGRRGTPAPARPARPRAGLGRPSGHGGEQRDPERPADDRRGVGHGPGPRDSRSARVRTATSRLSGTLSPPDTASSSSTWSGMPSERARAATRRGPAAPAARCPGSASPSSPCPRRTAGRAAPPRRAARRPGATATRASAPAGTARRCASSPRPAAAAPAGGARAPATTSRLRSSAQWRSSRASSTGRPADRRQRRELVDDVQLQDPAPPVRIARPAAGSSDASPGQEPRLEGRAAPRRAAAPGPATGRGPAARPAATSMSRGNVDAAGDHEPVRRPPAARSPRAAASCRCPPRPRGAAARRGRATPRAAGGRRTASRSSRPTRIGAQDRGDAVDMPRVYESIRRPSIGRSTDGSGPGAAARWGHAAPGSGAGPTEETQMAQVHGRPHRVHRRHRRAAPRGARPRPRDRAATRASTSSARGSTRGAGKVFCLATGPSKEAVMRIHERAGHPTPEVYELTVEVLMADATITTRPARCRRLLPRRGRRGRHRDDGRRHGPRRQRRPARGGPRRDGEVPRPARRPGPTASASSTSAPTRTRATGRWASTSPTAPGSATRRWTS